VAPSIRKKLAITLPTSGDRSVGIVRSRTQTMEFFYGHIITIILIAAFVALVLMIKVFTTGFWYTLSNYVQLWFMFRFSLLQIFKYTKCFGLSGHHQEWTWFVDPLKYLLLAGWYWLALCRYVHVPYLLS
jgi:hypothetical protein